MHKKYHLYLVIGKRTGCASTAKLPRPWPQNLGTRHTSWGARLGLHQWHQYTLLPSNGHTSNRTGEHHRRTAPRHHCTSSVANPRPAPTQPAGPHQQLDLRPIAPSRGGKIDPRSRASVAQRPARRTGMAQHRRTTQPRPWQQLHQTLVVLQDIATATGGQLSSSEARLPTTLAQAAARLPPSTLVHLPWALGHMTEQSGYIPATAQEALLHTYLGDRLAAQTAVIANR